MVKLLTTELIRLTIEGNYKPSLRSKWYEVQYALRQR